MAIPGVSSAGYNAINSASNYKKDTPPSKPISAAERTIDLKGVSLKGTALTETTFKYDRFEQSEKPSPPENLVHTPINTISIKIFIARVKHVSESLEKADSMNLSYGERMTFLKQDGENWVEDLRQNEPEMYVAWLRMNKRHIEAGNLHMASLPSNFTMSDYYSYVKTEA